jgi:hypothetical protein
VISFRYHLVSIIAVFLALAVGIVVGTTVVNGPVTTDLHHQVTSLKSQRAALNKQVTTLHGQVGDARKFASGFGPRVLAGALKGTKVLVVGLPGAGTGMEDAISSQLHEAGAQLTGRLNLAQDYVEQSAASKIDTLVTTNHPMSLTLPKGTSDARVLGAAALAFALLGKGDSSDTKSMLRGFANLHMFSSDAARVKPATSIVVVGSGTIAKKNYASQAELDLVNAVEADGATVVVAGDAGTATGGGIVAAVRGGSDRSTVSTVDNADHAFGQLSTVLALAQAQQSRIGHYGTARSADALFPSPTG